MAKDMAQETFDWATKEIANNKETIGKFTDQMVSDSDTARGMVQNFQDLSNKQLGLAEGAVEIKDAALSQATKQGAIQDTQSAIQQKQLGVQDLQLQYQKDQQKIQQDFRGDQQAIQQKSQELYDQYQKTYPGVMERFAADAEAYASPDRIAQARAGAAAGVGEQFAAARDAATRQLESFGVKPSDTRFASLDIGLRLKEAAQKAAAARQAELQAEDRGFQLRQQAIQQGQQIPGQATQMTGVANQAGSNVVGQGNVANAAGTVANQAGSVANTAGANVIGAGNAGTAALNTATGATNAATGATTGATQAQTGALAANTGAANITNAAGELTNRALQTEGAISGTAAPYVGAALGGVNAQTSAIGQNYKNQMDQFKAESTNTSGLGQLLGSVAGPVAKAVLTGGASIPFDLAGAAAGGSGGGSISTGTPEYGPTPFYAEGGAIPMSTSPSNGQQTDDVKAMLNAGEFIMPKDVTSWYGEKFFQNLIQKAQNEKSKAGAKPAIGPMPPGPPAVASGPSAMGAI